MRLAIGSDEVTHLTQAVIRQLHEAGHTLDLFGPLAGNQQAWPRVARDVAEAVAGGSSDEGILFCWTGTGVSIAANKVPGVRAALCDDAETARGARLWNNANVLCMSLRRTSEVEADEILKAWLTTQYQANPEDDACLAAIDELESIYRKP
jgi:ribose 5-phosphate isomerase B